MIYLKICKKSVKVLIFINVVEWKKRRLGRGGSFFLKGFSSCRMWLRFFFKDNGKLLKYFKIDEGYDLYFRKIILKVSRFFTVCKEEGNYSEYFRL